MISTGEGGENLPTSTGKIRVLFVTAKLDVGGTERHLLQVVPRLNASGFDTAIFVLEGGGSLTSSFRERGITVIEPRIHYPRYVRTGFAALSLLWHLATTKYDLVHYYLPAAYVVGSLCTLVASPAKRIMSRRSLNNYQDDIPLIRPIERLLHSRMHAILANSTEVARELVNEGAPRDRIRVLHNGIEVPPPLSPEHRASIRATLGVGEGCLVMTMVANLIPYKGHADVIKALANLQLGETQDWLMVFVGRDSGLGAKLDQLARELGVATHIRWLGERSDAVELMGAADIAIHYSHEEGFSNAVLEAMACEVPLIASDVGGNRDAVLHGTTGLLVPPKNPGALSGAIYELARSPEYRNNLANAAKARVAEAFSLDACTAGYIDVYQRVIGGFALEEPTWPSHC